ncbi:DNA polymerase III, epsilon subunit [Bartonella bacilliformis str. Heidi Mejia]|uniref:DNA polymerase III subunit epsilon n=2 Tax=Bartonella bacilliformis TaxID=774 RepID=A1UQU0_BARBK|nr:DNA polymerase III subunit epsilon [Bartonella bacilliformis]ABM45410.1 DNA polymerase III, epsilon subunit [Bartonella bacilliformis KC583]AMG85243.1 DNA polymerase III subunit epsilon [Bartonella bacilliformis]EKS46651.1 DNA polymerase III subunit epsilon [Bartonella bacilliformis INS]EYS88858.1 DNA polymerase III, epsilon subunit [Bartonella bacilliformis San Pedro600-02]EYS90820.1 DNA polymerase III, epsilon subunit [Bartonella bacilliformis str. Heidi Mejia]
MREIIFDTETTGLDKDNDRIIEIGCVEMVDRYLTGRQFHVYLNPQGVIIPDEVVAIHGLTNERLKGEKKFDDIADELLEFIDGAMMIAHNANFDISFLNAELKRVNKPLISIDNVIDTLAMARRKFPMGPNSLDVLCKRFGIDNSHRILHGALLDAEILADVYIELIGGKQGTLGFYNSNGRHLNTENGSNISYVFKIRPQALPPRLSEQEKSMHADLVNQIGKKALWNQFKIP